MASPQKHGGKKKVTWQWTKKANPQYPTNQYARYRGATPTPVKDMRIPVLGVRHLGTKEERISRGIE